MWCSNVFVLFPKSYLSSFLRWYLQRVRGRQVAGVSGWNNLLSQQQPPPASVLSVPLRSWMSTLGHLSNSHPSLPHPAPVTDQIFLTYVVSFLHTRVQKRLERNGVWTIKFASGSHAFQPVEDGGLVRWWLGTGGWQPLLGGRHWHGVCRGQRWSRGSREPGSSSTPASRGYTSSLSSGQSQKKQKSNSCHSKKQKIHHQMLTSGSQTPANHHRDMYTRIPPQRYQKNLKF